MIAEHGEDTALVVLANFVSPLAADLTEGAAMRQWAEQAPRKIWLTRPGDVLVTPVPLGEDFRRYAYRRLGMADDSVTVVRVPETPHVPMADAIAAHGLVEPLRELVRERPGARMLPTALDEPSVVLAARLGLRVAPYEEGGPPLHVLRATAILNTKSGFRSVGTVLGMRLPAGRTCTGAELPRVVSESLTVHERVVVKPDRSAGGHGMRFVARGERPFADCPPAGSRWVVEECVAHTTAVSVQGRASPRGADVLFDGEMRMAGGSFTGYRSPPTAVPAGTRAELAGWAEGLGRHLAALGYRGPFSLDAVCAHDGTPYALECNVRRTATTTVHAMVTRLTGEHRPPPAWSMGKVRVPAVLPFDAVVQLLGDAGLDLRPGDREGVLLYADRPVDGTGWRYAAVAADHHRLDELESRLTLALGAGGRWPS